MWFALHVILISEQKGKLILVLSQGQGVAAKGKGGSMGVHVRSSPFSRSFPSLLISRSPFPPLSLAPSPSLSLSLSLSLPYCVCLSLKTATYECIAWLRSPMNSGVHSWRRRVRTSCSWVEECVRTVPCDHVKHEKQQQRTTRERSEQERLDNNGRSGELN